MEKFTIEITPKGFTETLVLGDGKILIREHEMQSAGHCKCVSGGDWFDILNEEDGDLAEALDDIGFGPFTVAGQLFERN